MNLLCIDRALYPDMCLGSVLQEWEGLGKKQSILSFIECSVRWSHRNSIQTAQQSRAPTLILISVNTTVIWKIQENG